MELDRRGGVAVGDACNIARDVRQAVYQAKTLGIRRSPISLIATAASPPHSRGTRVPQAGVVAEPIALAANGMPYY
jgi:hypothetical protein